jgi:exodeoxyribonuclease V gamma subunit
LQETPLFLHQSNRLEHLFEQMCAVMREPLDDPLVPEIIVVHNQGMAQWIAQQIAFVNGIAANLQFPLPARFVWDLFHRIAEDALTEDLFAKPVLRWRIAALLPQSLGHPAFGEIAAYLQNDDDGCKHYQLAARISEVFDQYQVYRPDLLTRWEEHLEEEHWQALLWRQLTATAIPHRARLPEQFRQTLTRIPGQELGFTKRFHLFGINSLAPVYLEIIHQVSERSEVHLFHLSPCRHYWGDLVSARQVANLEKKVPSLSSPDLNPYYDQGNPLLVSLGRTGQDFFRQLLDYPLQEVDLYRENDAQHLLAALQNDILDLQNRSVPDQERHVLHPADRSLQFHRCFSPLREIQVLHDHLLDLFQQYPDLAPGDILVTAPDIEVYAGAIAGVFGEASQDRRIPWSIADQSLHRELPVVRCFLELLDLLSGRFTAPEVLALCETTVLHRRFGLDPAILPRLHTWVRDSGIRWGLDQEHRQQLGVDAIHQHSWQFGLDRLLLGYLMGECDEPYQGLLPYAHLAGSEAVELGGFLTLIETLAHWRRRLEASGSAADWCGRLLEMLEDFFDPELEDLGLATLRESINGFKTHCQLAGYTEDLTPTIVKHHLQETLAQPGGGQAFLSGRVTFCNMVPMRSVPFRIIWLLGMNDGDFPRTQHPAAFDLMAQAPRLGDRNRRHDDRYLFLEALLSARDLLALSWVGRSQRDDSVAPPSVVVCELQDYLNQSCIVPAGTVAAHLTTQHPMQPFSPRCFDGTAATASYNPAWQPAGRENDPRPFLFAALEPPGPEWRSLDIRQLVRFWRHPTRFFLEQIVGLQLWEEEAGIEESEPFILDPLQQYQVRQKMVHDLLSNRSPEQVFTNLTSSGYLPQGGFGLAQFTGIAVSSGPFAEQVRPLLTTPLPPLEVDCALGSFQLTGWLTDVYAEGRITWRSGALKGTDLIELWILHLLLNLLAPPGVALCSTHAARDASRGSGSVAFHILKPVVDPEHYLRELLDYYWQGLQAPLHFFPETSRAWAEAAGSGKERDKARAVWEDGFATSGEGSDLANSTVFRETDPLDDQFVALTHLFIPIFAHLEAGRAAA